MDVNFERKLLNYLYYDLNRLRYFIRDEIFEYDIQSSIHQFLILNYNNKNVLIHREKEGKIDHVIQKNDEKGNTIFHTFIELKSFIKKNEKLDVGKIEKDIEKLYNKMTLDSEGYLIIAINEKHLNSTKNSLFEIIEALNKKNVYSFSINKLKIKTRIIRSLKTSFLINGNPNVHKEQIRLFMFQIKSLNN